MSKSGAIAKAWSSSASSADWTGAGRSQLIRVVTRSAGVSGWKPNGARISCTPFRKATSLQVSKVLEKPGSVTHGCRFEM
eukprot:3860161-Prymnesium_polylepis.1